MTEKTIDKKIDELFAVVKKQKAEVEKVEKASKRSWNTNCSFKLYASSPLNIQTAQEDTIVKALAELISFEEKFDKANEILGLSKEFKHDGYSVEDWTEDFKKRIATIQLKAKKEKLKDLESRLNGIVSPEQRRQMELDAITNALSED